MKGSVEGEGRMVLWSLQGLGIAWGRDGGGGRLCYTVTSSLGAPPILLLHSLPHLHYLLLASPPLTSEC